MHQSKWIDIRTQPIQFTSDMAANPREPLNLGQPEGDWWIVPDALGRDRHGYIHDDDVRHWVAAEQPPEVSTGDVWVDVSLEQQMLGLYEGKELIFVTLISSAREGYLTPTGLFRIYDKATAWDLASKPSSSDPYYIEQVPWVMPIILAMPSILHFGMMTLAIPLLMVVSICLL